jgi:hypothetical protein
MNVKSGRRAAIASSFFEPLGESAHESPRAAASATLAIKAGCPRPYQPHPQHALGLDYRAASRSRLTLAAPVLGLVPVAAARRLGLHAVNGRLPGNGSTCAAHNSSHQGCGLYRTATRTEEAQASAPRGRFFIGEVETAGPAPTPQPAATAAAAAATAATAATAADSPPGGGDAREG